jgi:hypothetical protein
VAPPQHKSLPHDLQEKQTTTHQIIVSFDSTLEFQIKITKIAQNVWKTGKETSKIYKIMYKA